MLEFKNVSVKLPGGKQSLPFSVVMGEGEMTCLCGQAHSGKTELMLATMGLAPVASGFITVDGELVSPGSAYYFRQLMAYVPQRLPDAAIKVSEFCESVFSLHVNHDAKPIKEDLMLQWQKLGLDPSFYGQCVKELDEVILKLILISMLPLLRRPIVLVDDMPQSQKVYEFMKQLLADGAEVLYTCEDNAMPCDKLIKL